MKDFDFDTLKHMADRFTPLETGDMFLDARYEWQKNVNGVEWPYYRFFYHLTKMLRPKLTVELGGYQGTGAAHLAAGWSQGDVITIDHHTDTGDEENRERMLDAQRTYKNIFYLQGWTTPELAEANRGKHSLGDVDSVYSIVKFWKHPIDILFIDSWHVYEHAIADFEAYKLLMNSPGLVICDDITDDAEPGSPIRNMMQFWTELPEPKYLNTTLHPGCGMGFVKV